MLRWTVIFLVIAIIAAIFGFGGIAAGAAGIAKVLFFIFSRAFRIEPSVRKKKHGCIGRVNTMIFCDNWQVVLLLCGNHKQ